MNTVVEYVNRSVLFDQIDNEFSQLKFRKISSINEILTRLGRTDPYMVLSLNDDKLSVYDTGNLDEETSQRVKDIGRQVKAVVSKKKYDDFCMVGYVGDNYKMRSVPLFTIAKKSGVKGILVPDDSFVRWENDRKKLMIEKKKRSEMFFYGASTHKIRNQLSEMFPQNVIVTDKRIPMSDFGEYMYLLDLPGRGPWSYRFKYLFLLRSVVMKANTGWVNFYDSILERGKDYIEFDMGKNMGEQLQKNIKNMEKNIVARDKIRDAGYTKMVNLTSSIIDECWDKIIEKMINTYC